MTINEIESICAVDIYKNYTDAAYQLNVTPSVISKHIARVEEELGVKLFDRASKSKSATLTNVGESVLPLMHSICNSYSKISNIANTQKDNAFETIRIGYAPLVGGYKESDIICNFLLNNPKVQISRTVASNTNLINMLKIGTLDVVLLPVMGYYENGKFINNRLEGESEIESEYLFSNNTLRLGVSENHPLAKEKLITKDKFHLLKDETFIFSSVQADTFGSKQRNNIKELFGFENSIRMRFVDYTEPRLPLKIISSGAAVMMSACLDTIDYPGVVFIPVEGWDISVDMLFVHKKDNMNSNIQKLLDECILIAKDLSK